MRLNTKKVTIIIGILIIFFTLILSYYLITKEILYDDKVKRDDIKKIFNNDYEVASGENVCDIWDNHIVTDFGEEDLYYFNLETKKMEPLGPGVGIKINDKYIIWINPDDKIRFYKISIGEIETVEDNEHDPVGTSLGLYKDQIIWVYRDNDFVALDKYEIENKEIEQIINTNTGKSRPDIYNDKIVWSTRINDESVVILFYISSSDEIEIGKGINPRIWNDKIVFIKTDEEYLSLYYYSISNGELKKIPKSDGVEYFDLHDDKVVWNNLYGEKICFYDIKNAQFKKIIDFTNDEDHKAWSPAIWGNKIIFASNMDGESNLYLYEIPDDTIFGLEPTTFYMSMLTIIIILVVILALLVRRMKRKHKMEKINSKMRNEIEQEDKNEDTLEVEPIDVENKTDASKLKPKSIDSQSFNCPSCNKPFKLTESKRPLKIKCPHCGVQGKIK